MRKLLLSIAFIVVLNAQCTRGDFNQTVICYETKLVWQDNEEIEKERKSYDDAIDYCQELELNGAKDWRLPSINELKTIVDQNNTQTHIKSVFQVQLMDIFYSSTFYLYLSKLVWAYDFESGLDTQPYYTEKHFVRCVKKLID